MDKIKFKVGDIVKYIDNDPAGYDDEICQKYFRIILIDSVSFEDTLEDTLFTIDSVDKRYKTIHNANDTYRFFPYRFGKMEKEEYIILKLKGIVK